MQKLLMATDLSARSDWALERAVKLAHAQDSELTIVHVIDDDLPASLADGQKAMAQDSIHKHVERLTSDNATRVSIEVVFGKPHIAILEASERTGADLIVVGVHRVDAIKDMFRGTTVERIIRLANVPVLLVKDRVKAPYQQIMVGVDFSIFSRRAVEFAVSFVPDGSFHLVHAYDVPFRGFLRGQETREEVTRQHQMAFGKMIEDEMSTFLNSLDGKAPTLARIMQEGTVHEVIHQQIKTLEPDLLVIGTHGRTGVAHAFLGSVAEGLLTNPPCDVLAVKAW